MMDIAEGLFSTVCMEVNGTYDIEYAGHKISLKPKYKRIHMVDAIKEACGVDFLARYDFR